MKSKRIDELVFERGLSTSIDEAKRFIMAGMVIADDKRVDKSGTKVDITADIRIRGKKEFVSRGAYKLKAALDNFNIDVSSKVAIDIGSSTGGFTDVLLQYGATRVHAIDVGVGIIDNKFRKNEKVILHEGVNFRIINFEEVNEVADIVVADLSFISLTEIIPVVKLFVKSGAVFVALIKPQFELNKDEIGEGGIVTDCEAQMRSVDSVLKVALECGFRSRGVLDSPILGRKGNKEFLVVFDYE